MNVRTHPSVKEELDQAALFYDDAKEFLGDEFMREFRNAVQSILQDPARWPVGEYGFRKYILDKFPYTIRYIERLDYIYIVAVPHSSRRPGYWKKRISDEQR